MGVLQDNLVLSTQLIKPDYLNLLLCNYVTCLLQEPVKRVLGHLHGHRQKGAKRRRVQLNDEVIEIPFLESLQQWLNNPSILNEVNINYILF